jgi:hypothetical protein
MTRHPIAAGWAILALWLAGYAIIAGVLLVLVSLAKLTGIAS